MSFCLLLCLVRSAPTRTPKRIYPERLLSGQLFTQIVHFSRQPTCPSPHYRSRSSVLWQKKLAKGAVKHSYEVSPHATGIVWYWGLRSLPVYRTAGMASRWFLSFHLQQNKQTACLSADPLIFAVRELALQVAEND